MGETEKERSGRIAKVLDTLEKTYPDAKPELVFSSPYELLIATMLSAQCTDKQVNKCTAELFKHYSKPIQIASLTENELTPFIKACGLYKTKCRNIIAASKIIVERYDGEIPRTRDELMKLPGVGRKTANVVVSNAFGTPAIAVDTHVFRVANRIGLVCAKDVLETEKQLMDAIPREKWSIAHHWLIFHGRRTCSARNPKCETCTIKDYCSERLGKN